jgi:hypothetical protein
MIYRLTDWRLWLSWTFAMLATAAVLALWAMVSVVQEVQVKLDGRSSQSICLARLQGDFDRHIANLVIASVNGDDGVVSIEAEELRLVVRRYESVQAECPNPE